MANAKLWQPPRAPYLKINADAAFDAMSGKGNYGIVCRYEKGNLLTTSSTYLFAPSVLVAETLALRGAILVRQSLCLESVIFESIVFP